MLSHKKRGKIMSIKNENTITPVLKKECIATAYHNLMCAYQIGHIGFKQYDKQKYNSQYNSQYDYIAVNFLVSAYEGIIGVMNDDICKPYIFAHRLKIASDIHFFNLCVKNDDSESTGITKLTLFNLVDQSYKESFHIDFIDNDELDDALQHL